MILTKTQRKIVSHKNYPCFLRAGAGAGAGKTEVLIQKIGHLIVKNKSNLSNFAVITFTNKATDEMRERLYRELYKKWLEIPQGRSKAESERVRTQLEMCSMAQISTIHGFCEHILRTYGMEVGISPAFKVFSYRQQIQKIFTDVLNEYHGAEELKGIPKYKLTSLLFALLNDNSNRGIILDKEFSQYFSFSTPENNYFNGFKRTFIDIYSEAYERIEEQKLSENIFTLNDTIRMTAEILGRPDIAAKVSNKYRYLFIDEFQDVDKSQFNIVTQLIEYGTKVFIVGDEKQSIFRFRGADVQNVANMQDRISAFENSSLELRENFRSDKALIEEINSIFEQEYSFFGTKIAFPIQSFIAPENSNYKITENPFEITFEESTVSVVRRLLGTVSLNEKPIEYSDIGILCRRNFDIDVLAGQLRASGMPVEVFGGKGFYKCKEVIDTYKLLNAAIYKSDIAIDELKCTDYFQALVRSNNGFSPGDFVSQLDTVLRQSTIENSLIFAYEKSSILEYYRSKQQYQAIANLYKLKNIARELLNAEWLQPIAFLNYLWIAIKSHREEDDAEIPISERAKGIISICSIHKAKGLAFPVVVIPNCDRTLIRPIHRPKIILDSGSVPHMAIDHTALGKNIQFVDKDYDRMLGDEIITHLEEELRILYVALTRAKHKIVTCCVRSREDVLASNAISWAKWLMQRE